MVEEVPLDEFLKDPEKYCYKRDVVIKGDRPIERVSTLKCSKALAEALKRHGVDVFYSEEPAAYVAGIAGDVFIAFADVGCSKEGEFYISETWCWKRGLPPF
jgi:putative NIF3 family GTP cyclohydrolase 1 type 2